MRKLSLCACGFIAFIISALSSSAYTDYSGTMDDFMGINIHSVYWTQHYREGNEDIDLSLGFKWVRNYLRWDVQEPQPDVYRFNDDDFYGKARWLDEYYRLLNEDGFNIVVTPIEVPDHTDSFYTDMTPWFTGSKYLPAEGGPGDEPNHYRERAEFLAQLSARYGPTGGLSETRLETSDNVQGLDYVRYIEGANEPNQKWRDEIWPDAYYGQWMNAAHDGRGVIRDGGLPIAGIKQGDPNVTHVMCGLVENGVDLGFLDQTLLSAGRQAYDIINVHSYFRNSHLNPTVEHGVSPEYYILESGLDELQKTIRWRDENTPGTPVWLTEFGWDTHLAYNGTHSRTYAPEPSQGNYILRAFPLLKKIGMDKAFLYFDFDPAAGSPKMHSSSGIITRINNVTPLRRKPSYYYMTAMSAMVGEYTYEGAHIFGEGTPEVYAYLFSKSLTDQVIMIWCRERDSFIDNGTTLNNYVFSAPYMIECEQVVPTVDVIGGVSTNLSVAQSGQNDASVTIAQLSETPIFLKITTSQAAALNLSPVADAGDNLEAILPDGENTIDQIIINGSGSDVDGTIVGYQWTQLSGPSANMQQANTANLTLSNLTAGNDYEFALAVTDDDGAISRDRVSLIVADRQPFGGNRRSIPGVIEAEDYDTGGSGVAYYDSTGGSKGWYNRDDDVDIMKIGNAPGTEFYIENPTPGEWIKYSVTVTQSGLYTLDAKIGKFNANERRVYFEIDGVALGGIFRPLQTPTWTTFYSNTGEGPFYLEAGDHTLTVHFETAGIALDKFEFIVYDPPLVDSGNYFRFNNPNPNWQSVRVFYDTKWNDDIDVLAGGNTHLEFYITNLDMTLVPDWSKVKVGISDINSIYSDICIADYVSGVGSNWTLVSVPLSDLTAGNIIDLNHVMMMNVRSTSAGAFDIGIDEIVFTGGTMPFVWLGDDHETNPTSNSSIVMTVEPVGGIGIDAVYDEAPFVDAGPDDFIRPTLTSYTFPGAAEDIEGSITNYEWVQLSGPVLAAPMSGQYAAEMTATFNTFGTYEFRLYAWDEAGQRGEDDVTLVYEDTGGYISMEHTALNNQAVTMRYNPDEDPVNVLGDLSQPNDTLEVHFKRFDLNSTIDWSKFYVLMRSSASAMISANVGAYLNGASIDDEWVKVSIPLSEFGGVDHTQLTRMRFQSSKAGPFLALGIDEIQFTGGSKPVVFYGDDHTDNNFAPFQSDMTATFELTNGAVDTAP
ncbi:PKD domain-containing protein [Rubellicoccus peritrichatus]|uniref:DUF5010 C-terminal domain-containing protein n=1 Tax=Rubellicoccus peritrichatus TaxID=3080537 RepID=A0AAQ3QQ50_9BACT|nr:carbohydrate-binding domain-containing protein [Puniceicoccus sp. CR14]WOO39848.1 DUF5010 C-terminal domain-containing protein [Puniceicoccus sp. CR14]